MKRSHIRRDEIPQRLSSVTGYELASELLLYCSDSQRVHVLNASAAAVWDLCDGQRTVLEINRELASVLRRSNADLFPDIQLAVNELLKMEMIDIAPPPVSDAREVLMAMRAAPAMAMAIGFNGTAVTIHTEVEGVRAHLSGRFGRLAASGGEANVADFYVQASGDRYLLCGESGETRYLGGLGDVLQELEMVLVQTLVDANPDLLWMHAGAVADDGGAIMVVGPSGAGKSMFITGLARESRVYLSDDVLPVRKETSEALPFPLAPSVRLAAGPRLPAHRIQNVERESIALSDDQIGCAPFRLAAVLLPIFDAGKSAQIREPSPSQVARVLIENSLNIAQHRERAVAYLCELANTVPALELRYGDRAAALELAARALPLS